MARRDDNQGDKSFWQQGLSFFVQLSGWLVGPLVAALFLGKWLDKRYDTEPWLFLLSIGVAFLITSLGIIKEAMGFIKQIEREDRNKQAESNGSERDNSKSSK